MLEKIFKSENYYIFKVSLQKIDIRSKKPNLDYELIKINSLKELDNLIINNYNIDNLKVIEYFKRLFVKNSSKLITESLHSILNKKKNYLEKQNHKIFLYFLWLLKHYIFNLVIEVLHSIFKKKTNNIEKKNLKIFLYFQDNFLIHYSCYSESKSIDKVLNKFNGKSSVFIGPVFTNKKFRSKGFHNYDMVCRFNEYKLKGFKYIYGFSKTTNMESIFCFLSVGFKKIINVNIYRILKFKLFTRYHF